MQRITLGTNGPDVSRIGLGCMGMSAYYTSSEHADETSVGTLHEALDLGVTFFDTAENYGPYTNEELVARAFRGRRSEVVLATKFGMIRHGSGGERGADGSTRNARTALEGCLRRLQTDHIDVFYQHRADPNVPVEETMGALSEFVAEGLVRHIGLSEVSAATVRRAHAVHPVAVVQTEFSVWSPTPATALLPTLRELGIGLVAYAPLGRGFLTGSIRSPDDLRTDDFRRGNPRFSADNLTQNLTIADRIAEVAAEVGATAGQVALAWVLSTGDDVVPIPGTTNPAHLRENVEAVRLELSTEQLGLLSSAVPALGARYADMSPIDEALE